MNTGVSFIGNNEGEHIRSDLTGCGACMPHVRDIRERKLRAKFQFSESHLALWVSKDDTIETEALLQGLHTRHRLQENNHHNTHIGKT